MKTHRYLGGVVAVIVAVAAAGMPARASKPAGSGLDLDSWQARTLPLANQLSALGDTDADFAAVRLDYASGTVAVYRKGGAPAARYTSVQAPAGAKVQIRPALLSAQESKSLMDQVWAARPALAREGITVTGVSTGGGGAVTIHVQELTTAAQALPGRFNQYGPATVRVEQGDYLRAANRFNDPMPFYGGDRVASATGVLADGRTGFTNCTSGFGGRSAGNGADYVLMAYHCAKPGDPRFWTTNEDMVGQRFVGTATVLDAGHDIAYVRSSTAPHVWDGPIHPYSAQFTKPVTAMAKPVSGARICTSGSFSGARCYATIVDGGHFTLCGDWSGQGCWDVYVWYADADDWKSMCQPGDSGGPVFTPTGSTVTAIGIISGAGYRPPTTVSCSRVFFPDIYTEAWLNHQINLTQ